MKKSEIIGIVLIGLLLAGASVFPMVQTRIQQKKQLKAATEYVAEAAGTDAAGDTLDVTEVSVTAAEEVKDTEEAAAAAAAASEESAMEETAAEAQDADSTAIERIYKDDALNVARAKTPSLCRIGNDKIEVEFTTRGAQPYTVKVRDYSVYHPRRDTSAREDLKLVREGMSYLAVGVYTGELINTADLVFEVVESSDTSVVMRLPFSNGGYIEQKYTLEQGSYLLKDDLSFVGLQDVIPSKVSTIDVDWAMIVPRLEKGYKNEKQYSNLSYYFEGEKKPETLTPRRGNYSGKAIPSKVRWVDFKQQFFSAIINAPEDFLSGQVAVSFADEQDYMNKGNLMTCSAKMVSEISHSDNITVPYEFYFGPNDFRGMKKLGQKYEKVIPLGGNVVGLISRGVIIPTFHLLNRWIGNYGLIILIMTILIKLVISPLTIKSYRSSAMMSVLKPEMDKLNEKYPKPEDAMKKQQAQMELYKKVGVSPMGGCLPMLLQLPVLYAMFRFFPASIELRQEPFLWAEDLSSYDSILNIGTWHISLFSLLMAVTMFFYSKMNSKSMGDDPNMAPMRFMSVWLMPIMMFFICNGLSSALSYYYLLSNLLTMLQTWIIKRFFIDEEKILAKARAKQAALTKKSKWQLRLEEAQRIQAEQMKKRR